MLANASFITIALIVCPICNQTSGGNRALRHSFPLHQFDCEYIFFDRFEAILGNPMEQANECNRVSNRR
uniref:Putative secreted protein n=1 Tax=Anopheles triannulatus TaxID=58253 RepID=A0A2M4B2V7_9DIPT